MENTFRLGVWSMSIQEEARKLLQNRKTWRSHTDARRAASTDPSRTDCIHNKYAVEMTDESLEKGQLGVDFTNMDGDDLNHASLIPDLVNPKEIEKRIKDRFQRMRKKLDQEDLGWRDRKSKLKQAAFLACFAETGAEYLSCAASGLGVSKKNSLLRNDTSFQEAYEQARELAIEQLEIEARRRAVEGYLEPVFYKGEECGHVRKYSDKLLVTLLKGSRPEKYKERVEHSGGVEERITANFDLSKLSTQELKELERLSSKIMDTEETVVEADYEEKGT